MAIKWLIDASYFVAAVLFILGCEVAGREECLVDAIRRGFALGNHSYSHPSFQLVVLMVSARRPSWRPSRCPPRVAR